MTELKVVDTVYEGIPQKQLVGLCELTSKLSEKEVEYTNKKGELKSYKIANIKVLLPTGVTTVMPASVPELIQERMVESGREFTIGENYLTTLTAQPDRNDPTKLAFFARMSHLQNAGVDNALFTEIFGAELGFGQSLEVKTADKPVIEVEA